MGVRAVLFDLGNTLLEYASPLPWRAALPNLFERIFPLVVEALGPAEVTPREFGLRLAAVVGGEKARGFGHSGRSWRFADRLKEGLESVGLEADSGTLERLTDEFYRPVREVTRPYPETLDALMAIQSLGVQMAIITNAPWDTPERLVRGDAEHWGLSGFFDAFVGSGDVPWRKPNPEFMWEAARRLTVSASDCLVVGDRPERDIAGARAAGMRSVWVNRDGQPLPEEGPKPDWVVEELGQVVAIAGSSRR